MNRIALALPILLLIFSCAGPIKKAPPETSKSLTTPVAANTESFISKVPEPMDEISGMLIWKDLFWGFNDSGGDPILFGFDKAGDLKMEIEVENATNRDWESITQDDDFVYVGDFGNNSGNRKDLVIYKISKKDVSDEDQQKVNAKMINIRYQAQTEFEFSSKSTAFDCEGMAELNGKLYMFSKNWSDNISEVYALSPETGEYQLTAIDTLQVNMLVTGADFSPDKTKLALIGYRDYQSYLWIFSGFEGDNFSTGEMSYYHLTNIAGSQTEGIYFLNNDSVLISCEQTDTFVQQVFLFDLNHGTHQDQ